MRILSQDGKLDIPYDSYIVFASGTYVNARIPGRFGIVEELGNYKSEERAMEVVSEIIDKYTDGRRSCTMPIK